MWIHRPHNHSDLTDREIHHKGTFPEMLIQTTNYHLTSLQGAGTVIDIEETRDSYHLNPNHHPQTAGSKVTGAWCWLPNQCHCYQTSQKATSIPREIDNVGKLEPTWKLICPSLKTRMQRMLWHIKVGGGIWQYTVMQDAEIIHSSHTPFDPCKATLESWCRALGWI